MATSDTVSLDFEQLKEGGLRLVVQGKLDAENAGRLWRPVLRQVAKSRPAALEVDAGRMESCDGAGIALLLELKARQEAEKRIFRIRGLANLPKHPALLLTRSSGPARRR